MPESLTRNETRRPVAAADDNFARDAIPVDRRPARRWTTGRTEPNRTGQAAGAPKWMNEQVATSSASGRGGGGEIDLCRQLRVASRDLRVAARFHSDAATFKRAAAIAAASEEFRRAASSQRTEAAAAAVAAELSK